MSNQPPEPLALYEPHVGLLEQRVILLTGAASGIGREVARALCVYGAQVVLLDRAVRELETLYDEIQAQWYDDTYWTSHHGLVDELDALIDEFNARTGLLKGL